MQNGEFRMRNAEFGMRNWGSPVRKLLFWAGNVRYALSATGRAARRKRGRYFRRSGFPVKPAISVAIPLLLILSIYLLTSGGQRADFTYVNPSGIHTLDPARMSWTQDFRVALNIWEGLTTWDPQTTRPIQGAALLPEVSPDGLTFTFTIRDDARWSNGAPVTAEDFLRGWRRGMEPGTATDYTSLFTDHIAGAEEYVQWRRKSVAVLTALSRLRGGWKLSAHQARALAGNAALSMVRIASPGFLVRPADHTDEAAWGKFADQLSSMRVDWDKIHDHALDAHVAEFDDRFAAVGISALGDRTLTVELIRPCPYFLDLTSFPTFLPCHRSIELLRERYRGGPVTAQGLVVYDPQWTKPDYHRNSYPGLITNGAYRLADWKFKRRARLVVNPHFRDADTIDCRTVDMLVYSSVSASIMAYEAGDVDFLPDMSVPYSHEIARLSRSGERPDFHQCIVLATYFFNYNCVSERVGDYRNPMIDRRVRKAFSLAVDKNKIVSHVLGRGDRVANSFVPAGAIPGYTPPAGLARDVEQARRLLGEAGYEGGVGLPPIQILYTQADERVCQALARMWEEQLNVTVELRCKESKTFADDKANHRYMVARGNWYADYDDPTTFLNCLTTGNGNNDSGYSNPAYDDLLAQAARADDSVTRAGLLAQAEALIVGEDCPILPILHHAEMIAIKPYVRGLYPNARLWFPFRHVRIER